MKKFVALVLALSLVVCIAAGCSKKDDKTIRVGASVTPHAEILEVAKELLAEEGYTLEIT